MAAPGTHRYVCKFLLAPGGVLAIPGLGMPVPRHVGWDGATLGMVCVWVEQDNRLDPDRDYDTLLVLTAVGDFSPIPDDADYVGTGLTHYAADMIGSGGHPVHVYARVDVQQRWESDVVFDAAEL